MEDELKDFRLSHDVKVKLKDKKSLSKEIASGKSAQEIMEFSNETMAKFYKAAYLLFEHKHYEDAGNAFLFLATLNPRNHEYWLGLGMASQLNGNYEAAIDAYELAAITNIESPVAYFYLAKCLFAIHDRESSLQALELAIEMAGDSPEFADLKSQAETARALLLKNEPG